MVEIAWEDPGVYGARMTGAGFGGCAVASWCIRTSWTPCPQRVRGDYPRGDGPRRRSSLSLSRRRRRASVSRIEKRVSGMRVLVTGGAGYIGSHTVKALL